MKRKFKLFATLASLCLSVALMAFGVYAATNVTYNVTSTVSFVSQVVGEFSYNVVGGDNDDADGTSRTGNWVLNGSETHDYDSTNQTYGAALSESVHLEDPAFNPATNKLVIEYEFYFENNSTDTAALLSVAYNKLFAYASNEQLQVEVGKAVAATKEAALSAAQSAKAIANGTTAAVAVSENSVAAKTANDATDVFCLYVRVQLLNTTHMLVTSGEGQNDTLDITFTVVPASA